MMRHYLDYNATAPMPPDVKEVFLERLGVPSNASSVHQEGRAARKAIERARTSVAELVGGNAKGVVFTGGGTEGNNTVLSPKLSVKGRTFNRLLVSAVEHPCVLAGGRFQSHQIDIIPVDENGILQLEALETRLAELARQDEAALVSVMHANNETGVIEPLRKIADIVHAHGGLLHSDMVQTVGKLDLYLPALGVDVVTISAHKFGGPQGVGAIVKVNLAVDLDPLTRGGGQELGQRAGTESVAAIAAFGKACEIALQAKAERDAIEAMRDRFERQLHLVGNDIRIFAKSVDRLGNTSCFSLPDKRAETALISYDMAGVAVSSGSACSSGKVGASHVLDAMGVTETEAQGAIRVSFGWNNKEADVDAAITATRQILRR